MDESGQGFAYIEAKLHLVDLESQRSKILLDWEETRRLKSRAIWLQVGDGNTIFFHKYANGRKANNTISQIPSALDQIANKHPQLAQLGISHFKQLLKAPQGTSLAELISVAGHFPGFVGWDGRPYQTSHHGGIREHSQVVQKGQKSETGWLACGILPCLP